MAALQDVVDSHPGLMFLQDAPEFHSRYVQTVIFSTRCNIYISRLCHDASPSVCLSVCDVCALWSQGAMDPGYLCMLG